VVLRHQWREGSEGTTTNHRKSKHGRSSPRRGKNSGDGSNPNGIGGAPVGWLGQEIEGVAMSYSVGGWGGLEAA
jgi:hypothetical protein